jgi:hypothetical protein
MFYLGAAQSHAPLTNIKKKKREIKEKNKV